ncbi:MAG: hypothetical protein ACLGI2_07735 [Acidimicrobiia bacterium]
MDVGIGEHTLIPAVIRSDTPQLVEDDDRGPCRAGERVVAVARRGRLPEVIRELTG